MTLACAFLAGAVVLVAWPIWRYLHEHSMFTRRALLAGVTTEDSRVRRWFWAGRVLRVAQVFSALAWAVALVAFAHLFSTWHWAVLAVDAVLVALAARVVTRQLAADVRPEMLGAASRRWPLALGNIALLAIAFMAIDFFLGAPDTRGQAWHEVAQKAFDGGATLVACPGIAWVVGALAAADALAWHAAEVLIPSLPNQWLKLVAWMVFLLQAGIVAIAWTRTLLGVGAFLDHRAKISSRSFFVTTALIALAAIAMAFLTRDADLPKGGKAVLDWTNPCRTDPAAAQALRASLVAELESARVTEREHARKRVEEAVGGMYGQVEKGADAYLDWYFTVLGEYERLAALVTGGLADKMRVELESRLFGEFSVRLDEVSGTLAAETAGRLRAAGGQVAAKLGSATAARPCLADAISFPRVADLDRDVVRASTAAAAGAAVGTVVAAAIVRRAAAAAAARIATTRSFRGATSLAGRTAAKRGGSALGAGAIAAAACGPAVVFCASVAAIVTWVALDKTFIEVDEMLSRKEMRREILEAAGEQQAALVQALVAQQHAAIDRAIADIDASIERTFVPARQGI